MKDVTRTVDEDEPLSGKEEVGELEKLRRLVVEYEACLSQAADLAARVRHEINNPLTGLLGQAQLLQREELSDGARRRVGTIEHLALRIRDTAAELRDVRPPNPPAATESAPAPNKE